MTPRSYLFVPADRPERFAKALACGADAIIIDLEDAVAPAAKAAARRGLAEWLAGASGAERATAVVRINAADTEWFRDDLSACHGAGLQALMVPKAECAQLLADAAAATGCGLIALVESALGFDNLRAIAHAPPVRRIAFGSIDFQLDMGIPGDAAGGAAGGGAGADAGEDLALLSFRSQLVLASRVARLLAPIDGVTTSIAETRHVSADALRARRLGFGAKLCIHPAQVQAVNLAFSPSAAELAWAQRVLAAAAAAGGAAVAVDGKMIDRPVLLRAQALLQQARAAA